MLAQVATTSKLSVAFGTKVGFFLGVCSHVSIQVHNLDEGFIASFERTRMMLGDVMNVSVVHQSAQTTKVLLASVALEPSVLRIVHSLVFVKFAL